jgi:hypothetical protein
MSRRMDIRLVFTGSLRSSSFGNGGTVGLQSIHGSHYEHGPGEQS